MIKILILFSLFPSHAVFAGSGYCYLGKANVVSVKKPMKKKNLHVQSITLKISNFLQTFGSARQDSKNPRELIIGNEYLGIIIVSKDNELNVGQEIFFRCSWSCNKVGCTDKKWTLLSETEAQTQAGLSQIDCN